MLDGWSCLSLVTAGKQKARGRGVYVFITIYQHRSVLGEQFLFMFSEEFSHCLSCVSGCSKSCSNVC